jgi:hypothetical protein
MKVANDQQVLSGDVLRLLSTYLSVKDLLALTF